MERTFLVSFLILVVNIEGILTIFSNEEKKLWTMKTFMYKYFHEYYYLSFNKML